VRLIFFGIADQLDRALRRARAEPRTPGGTNSNLHKGVDPMYWRIALLVLLIMKAELPDEQALRLLNHYRRLTGLTPVKLDRKLSAGCIEHAN
jgi:hypothetical protein